MKKFLCSLQKFSIWRGVLILTLLGPSLSFSPLKANILSIEKQSVGSVKMPEGAIDPTDFIIAVFTDNLTPDPVLKKMNIFRPEANTAPVIGCLSVAQLQLHSGQKTFHKKADLTFGCSEVPEGSHVYGWIDDQWRKVPFTISASGVVTAEIIDLTTYAIFPREPGLKVPAI